MVRLSDFTDEQTALATAILERVFVRVERFIGLPPEAIDVVVAMIADAEDTVARLITQAMGATALIQMAPALVELRGLVWLEWVAPEVLTGMFSGLRVPLQRKILEDIYTQSPYLYDVLRHHSSGQMVRVGNAFVSKAKGSVMIETRVDRLLALIMDDTEAPTDMEAAALVLRKDFDWDDVVRVVAEVVAEMTRLALPLVTATDFKKYLKLHWMLAYLPRSFPNEGRVPLDRIVVDAIYRMPDVQWVLKVLNQFPRETIAPVLELIRADKLDSDLSKRNRATKLMNDVMGSIDMPNFENVRWVLDSVPVVTKE